MTVALHLSAPLSTQRPVAVEERRAAGRPPALGGIPRKVGRGIWNFLVNAISGSSTAGIDESAFPSGFEMPYKRGSRGVRNLWHIPF